ncbi:TrkH family potassium uptake protein [Hugenholtzia roseola]|uniref:TrkH family potassium uptake protein n=1 Tax=Hugenholtzia roseola TaxID=1002 RepID=UPI00040B9114|nr:potassium transporter TrkG [Hugenholtzia roseola]
MLPKRFYLGRERLKNYIFNSRHRVQFLTEMVAILGAGLATVLLFFRYGFHLSVSEEAFIFRAFDAIFALFVVIYGINVFYDRNWRAYLRRTPLEGLLMGGILGHGIINLLFDTKLLFLFLEWLAVKRPALSYQHAVSLVALLLIGTVITKGTTRLSEINFKPSTTFLLSFIFLILGGAGLLMLPTMTNVEGGISFLDALFTSTSASCVTGLIVLDTPTDFTFKGQLVILFLIQLGGIGLVSFATFFATFLSKGVGLKHQLIIQDYLNSETLVSTTSLLRKIIFITLGIEAIGAVLIYFSWDEELMAEYAFKTWGEKVYFSIFHSISAFCNAGFSLFSGGMNDTVFQTHRMYLLHFVLVVIILFGGLGYTSIEEIFSIKNIKDRLKNPWKKLGISSKINLYSQMGLLAIGTVAFMLLEFDKLTDRTVIEAFVTALFQSAVTRTAGFNSVDFEVLEPSTLLIFIFLMFVGGASGSTAGGIKLATGVILFVAAISTIRRQENLVIGKRTISEELVRKAFAIFIFAVAYNFVSILLLMLTETPSNPQDTKFMLKIFFEQVSAFATVGLSMNLTGELSAMGKVIIICSMYLGRVGTLTLAFALSNSVVSNSYRYPNAHIMVG